MSSGMLPQVVNFAVMVGFLGVFGKKPFQAFLAARSEEIKKEVEEAEKESKEVLSQYTQAKENITHKEAQVAQLKKEAETALKKHQEKTLSAAKHESERIIKDGELLGQGETHKKKEALQREISEKAIHLAHNYLHEKLEEKDREKLIGEYIQLVDHGRS